jgi:hypothetical protein
MPLGFQPSHPEGMTENSPAIYCWGHDAGRRRVPQGRKKDALAQQAFFRPWRDL